MKSKPAVKNNLLLKNAVTLNGEDDGQTLRCIVHYGDLMRIVVHEPPDETYKNLYILLDREQMESLVTLWNEWKDEESDEREPS